jgi:DHA1 family bicyclomycin/chloramphenicol resistance-like MFS transporter
MIVLVASGATSIMAIVGPMAVYGAGVGLTMPQAMASALMPFPDRAGTASSLLGICQMSFAALLGIALGQYLDGSALPLPIAIAATGLTALVVFLSTARARTPAPGANA